MTRLENAAGSFAAEALDGLVRCYGQLLRAVPGGVVRSSPAPSGQVALVIGGGSGHFPAFAGWVGPGLAHGAVCGNVFSAPSASQVYSVCRNADGGAGILLGFGNYAGDAMQFGLAAQHLRDDGVDTRAVAVSDDVASAPAASGGDRRGIAGDLLVFKVAGAAAAQGYDISGVEEVALRANKATKSLGVAFSGCALPGVDHPLFGVPEGKMALGLGVHGEPGLAVLPRSSADEVADMLLGGLVDDFEASGIPLSDRPCRVAVLVNNLGGLGYEELFVVFRRVSQRLAEMGVEVVLPEVGPHVTSLDMAGLSLTIMQLDEELGVLWAAPANAPAFRRGVPVASVAAHFETVMPVPVDCGLAAEETAAEETAAEETAEEGSSSPETQRADRMLRLVLRATVVALTDNQQYLGDLDAIAGDGDHGQAMVRGAMAALEVLQRQPAAGTGFGAVLRRAGQAWSDGSGGSSGALWCAALEGAGDELAVGRPITDRTVLAAVRAGVERMSSLGGAKPGDKTLLDAAYPFLTTLEAGNAEGARLVDCLDAACEAASAGARSTSQMVARAGRARAHGAASLGSPDPGAVSMAIVLTAVAGVTNAAMEASV